MAMDAVWKPAPGVDVEVVARGVVEAPVDEPWGVVCELVAEPEPVAEPVPVAEPDPLVVSVAEHMCE